MFGRKAEQISELKQENKRLQYDRNDLRTRWKFAQAQLREAQALNEKLFNAIDKKDAKIQAMQYLFDNPGSGIDLKKTA